MSYKDINSRDVAGDPHNAECFLCKHAGGLIECRRCPRAYCKGCIMASSREPGNFDSWDCPACVLLGLGEARDDAVVDQPPTKPTVEAVNSKLHPPTPTPAHAIAAENIKGVSQPSSSYIQIVTNRRSETPTKAGMSLDSKAVKLGKSLTCIFTIYALTLADQERGKKRSRYSTLPSEVDEALAIINRELEAASYSKSIIAHTEARLHVAEQDLAIERGKSALAVPNVNQDEICKLQDELKRKNAYIEQLLKEKAESQAEASKYASKVRELEDWKRRMKMMIDGTAES